MKHTIQVPYYCQFDNTDYPGGTCNVTSLAMCLAFYGIHPEPSGKRLPDFLSEYCDANGLDRHSLDDLRHLAAHFGMGDQASYDEIWADVKAHLLVGDPVIIQGQFTPSGHVLVVCGFDEERGAWYVNDPAGDWNAENHYREPGWREGNGVWYDSTWFKPAAAPDGKIWTHFVSRPH